MPRIGVSGHRGFNPSTTALIDRAMREKLAGYSGNVVGLSCLADGADQIFARAVIELGGVLEAVIPAEQYRTSLPAEALAAYDDLLDQAVAVHQLPFAESTSESHMAASKLLVDEVSELYAVWDGQPARGYGGTADVVAYAREHDTPVQVIWPAGAERD
jgi:hypothetical protein